MTEIENLKNKMISFEKMVDNDNLETIESLTNNLTSIYYSIFSDETFISPIHQAKFDELFASVELLIQNSNFDLLGPSQFANFLTEGFIDKNLLEL